MATAVLDEIAMDVPDGYELVNGELVEISPMSAYAGLITNRLSKAMNRHDATERLGTPLVELYFRVPTRQDPTLIRRPDLAFVYYSTLPEDQAISYTGNPLDIRPELIVEVISPTDTSEEVTTKKKQYLQAGVKNVWIVHPAAQEIYCYEGKLPPRIFGIEDTLNGGTVLPGFQIKLEDLFPPVIPGSIPAPKDDVE